MCHSPFPLLAAALSVLMLSACGKPGSAGASSAASAPPTPQVGVVTIQPQNVVLNTELPGRTTPVLVADVRPQVTGLIRARLFKEGSEVKAGQLLYEIDPANYKAAVDSAKATLAKAQSSLVSTRLKAERYQELVTIKAVSQQDNDDQASLMKQGEADVASAKASLESGQVNLAYTRVTSPITGHIGKSAVTVGALVTAAQTNALVTVQKLDPMYVDLAQSTTALLRLRRAFADGLLTRIDAKTAKVYLLLEDGSRYPLTGKLQFAEVTVDQNTGAVTLRAEFPNPKRDLLPGMYVQAVLEEGVREQGLLVPQPGVNRDTSGKPIAYVVGADDKIEQRALTTDRAIGDKWLVSSGLKAGDRVVVAGMQKTGVGAKVEPVAYSASAASAASTSAAGSAASAASAPSTTATN